MPNHGRQPRLWPSVRARGTTLLYVGLGFAAVACSHDLEELYGAEAVPDAGGRSGADAGAVDMPLLPDHGRIAYIDRPACAACFRGRCATEEQACRDNVACATVQACLSTCRDPGCNWQCFGEQDRLEPDRENGTINHPQLEALTRCRDTSCPDACVREVDSYGCVGQYDRRSGAVETDADLVTFPTNLVDGVGKPVPDAVIRLCSQAQTDCAVPLATTRTGDDGRASLSYSVTATISGTFGLYMEAPAVPDGVLATLLYPPDGFFTPGLRYGMQNFTQAQAAALELLPGVKAWPSFEVGAIAVVAFDCAAGQAKGLTLEVEDAGDASRVVYPGSQEDASGATGFAIAQGLAPGLKTYWLRRADTGVLLRREQVLVRPATLTIVWSSPPDEAPRE